MAAVTAINKLEELESFLVHATLKGGVVLLLSEDEQLRELALKALEESLKIDYSDDFNVGHFDARDAMEEALLAAKSYPMMAEFRYVRVDHLEGLKGLKAADKSSGKGKTKSKAAEKGNPEKEDNPLAQYLADPLPTTLLLLTGSKLDQRTKFFGTMKKAATLICNLEVPSRRELPYWISRRAKFYGVQVAGDAVSLLADVVGSNLQLIERSLEQLRDYVYPDKVVSASAVEEMICRSNSQSIFEMTDAIGEGNGVKALSTLRAMEEDGQAALMVSAMITRHFRQLLAVAAAMRKGGNSRNVGQQLGLNPFVAEKLIGQTKQMNYRGLIGAFPKLLDLDIALKSGASSPYGAIEDTLLELMPTLTIHRR